MAGGGGSSGGITSFLPIAAALAATVATDGAASPWLVDAMGATAAGALTSGAAAAAASGITAAMTGQNVGKAAIMGGISGGVGGAFGTAAPGSSALPTGVSSVGVPVSGALATADQAGIQAGTNALTSAGAPTMGGTLGVGTTPLDVSNAVSSGQMTMDQANAYGQGYTGAFKDVPANTVMPPASGSMGNAAKWGLGATALGALITADNKKYGVPSPASQVYNGPLSQFKYDPSQYHPTIAAQPSPAYQATYPNYVANPYHAAEGGVIKMAMGGIADANNGATPAMPPSGGPVEQMSRDNALGQNQMFPQSQLQSSAFSSPTNTPMGSNLIAAAGDTNVDPYTGAEKFVEGGLAATPQAQTIPSAISQNSFNTNDSLMQNLVSRMATRNAVNPVPSQVAPAQPTGIMAAAPQQAMPQQAQQPQAYTPPTFTRTTAAPVPFINPVAITGTAQYNAKVAADAEAQRQAQMAAAASSGGGGGTDYGGGGGGDGGGGGGGGGDGGGDGGGAGGLPKDFKKYATGGKTTSNMAAVDDYITQYQTESTGPATVAAKAKAGDWNAMIALNKINSTPNQNYAAGGDIQYHLGGYSDGGRLLKGPGDGMSDNIPATIGNKQPARLADGEFVVPADVVSHLGNGSTDAGAKHLYNMMDKVRKARTGTKKQGTQIKPAKYLKT